MSEEIIYRGVDRIEGLVTMGNPGLKGAGEGKEPGKGEAIEEELPPGAKFTLNKSQNQNLSISGPGLENQSF